MDAGLEKDLWNLLGSLSTSEECRALSSRFLSSCEFSRIRARWKRGSEHLEGGSTERGEKQSPENNEEFVRLAYLTLLGRPADEDGLGHYTAALASGDTRANVLRALVLSDEFERRYRGIPRDTQLCQLANPAKWDNEAWIDFLLSLGLSDDKLLMHRKPYEFAQLLFGCRRLGALGHDAAVVGIGAGHEQVLYWLANHVRRVVATDLYEGAWQESRAREGDPIVLSRPEAYAPFPYRRDHLIFMRMDARHLAFRSGSFDIAYSLSSIEHFGGMAGATAAVREMTRVLRPGGTLALATEYVLDGPPREETFQPHEFHRLIDQPGLELVEPFDEGVYRRYDYAPVDLAKDPYQTPHMVVRLGDTVFTSAMVFLRKR